MLFNSIDFILFLPISFLLYWFVFNKTLKSRNFYLLFISYLFYGWWDWKFLGLLFTSTLIDYLLGLQIYKNRESSKAKLYLIVSLSLNLGFLCFFKYFNFFLDSFIESFTFLGGKMDINRLDIILPVGISFYTFQTLSYSLDIYKGKLEPDKNFVSFAAFVSFFPQLVAGPIERAINLLPQFQKIRKFNYNLAVDGLRQILWGFFKKIVIADNCAEIVDQLIYHNPDITGGQMIIGVVFFTFQIYGDFSGYSDIAIGVAKQFNFKLMTNFKYPFFSMTISEFWRRWHISLSSWLNDYLFLPLAIAFRDYKKKGIYFGLFLTFALSGLWHGAGWGFVTYGVIHAIYFISPVFFSRFSSFSSSNSANLIIEQNIPSFLDIFRMTKVFMMFAFSLIFFISKDITIAISYIKIILTDTHLIHVIESIDPLLFVFIFLMLIIEWKGRNESHPLKSLIKNNHWFYRYSLYFCLVTFILLFSGKQQEFIYFQF